MDQSVARGDDDWGYQSVRGGMAIEAKLGLFIIVILLGAFGFLVYRNVDLRQRELIALEAEGAGEETQLSNNEHRSSGDFNRDVTDDADLPTDGQGSLSDGISNELSMEIASLTTETDGISEVTGLDEPATFEFQPSTSESVEQIIVSDQHHTDFRDDAARPATDTDPFEFRNETTSGNRLSQPNEIDTDQIGSDHLAEQWTDVSDSAVVSGTGIATEHDVIETDLQPDRSELNDVTGASGSDDYQAEIAFGEADDEITEFAGSQFAETSVPVEDSFSAEDTNARSVTDSDQADFYKEDARRDQTSEADPDGTLIVRDLRIDSDFEANPDFTTVQEIEEESAGVAATLPQLPSFASNGDSAVDDFSTEDKSSGYITDLDQESVPGLSFESELVPSELADEAGTYQEPADSDVADASPFLDISTPTGDATSSTNPVDTSPDEIVLKEFSADEGSGLLPVNSEHARRKSLSTGVSGEKEFNVHGFTYENRVITASAVNVPCDLCEVAPGDNYWKISRRVYGTSRYFSALTLYNHHRIRDPRRLRPGMKVLVPPAEVLEQKYPDLFRDSRPVEREPGGYFVRPDGTAAYRIGERDTLSEIAQKHLGRSSRWIQIYRLNRTVLANPNKLKPGTVIVLPDDATDVHMVP